MARARLLENLVKELGLAKLPDDKVERAAEDVTLFVRSTRIHRELLERYNPKDGLSVEERTQMTANRVGLNTPLEYKPPSSSEQ